MCIRVVPTKEKRIVWNALEQKNHAVACVFRSSIRNQLSDCLFHSNRAHLAKCFLSKFKQGSRSLSEAQVNQLFLDVTGGKSFIFTILFAPFLALALCMVVLHPLCFLADEVSECISVKDIVGNVGCCHDLGGKLSEFLRDAMQNGALVIIGSDCDSSSS